MNGEHVPDEGPPGLERRKRFLPFYEVLVHIFACGISEKIERAKDKQRVEAFLREKLPIRRQEQNLAHPLEQFFERLKPEQVHAISDAFQKLYELFSDTETTSPPGTPQERLKLAWDYFLALQSENLYQEKLSAQKPIVGKLPPWRGSPEDKERLNQLLDEAYEKVQSKFAVFAALLLSAMRQSLVGAAANDLQKNLDPLLNQVIDAGLKNSLDQIIWRDANATTNALWDLRATFPGQSGAYETLSKLIEYFQALEAKHALERRILNLYKPKKQSP